MSPFRRILVATAGEESDEPALALASRLAELDPATSVVLAHVVRDDRDPFEGLAERARARVLARLPSGLAARLDEGRARLSIVPGERLDALLDQTLTHASDLVVVGQRERRGGRRSLARRLAMKAPCSVLLVPRDATASLERLLVPVDFSPMAADALGVATQLAAAAGVERCQTLHVRFDASTTTYEEHQEAELASDQQAFAIFLARVDFRGVDVEPLLEEGANVAGTILRVAEENDSGMIVMGTRGRSRAASVLLGSETEHVLMASTRSVLAVKHFGARMRFLQALLDPRFRRRSGAQFT